ncbi:MAG: hypothetical protein K8H88_09740 [Sandaracinaceae bacterium]|nr:hypothetical protein [Sandaracinaceae bacterium]
MTIKIAFYTTGDRRSVPVPTDATTTRPRARASRRPGREPRSFDDQSQQWAAYARVLDSSSRIYGVNSTRDAATQVRNLPDGSVNTVYFVGHGYGGDYFRVNTTLTDSTGNGNVAGPASAELVSPWAGSTTLRTSDSLGFVQALASKLSRRGEARLEFRCCNLSPTTAEGLARALVCYAQDRTVRALGYTSELVVALQSGNRWRAALARSDGREIAGTTTFHGVAPPFQIDVRAQFADGRPVTEEPRRPGDAPRP